MECASVCTLTSSCAAFHFDSKENACFFGSESSSIANNYLQIRTAYKNLNFIPSGKYIKGLRVTRTPFFLKKTNSWTSVRFRFWAEFLD